MTAMLRYSLAALSAAAALMASFPAAGEGILYDLRPGSSISDDCLLCDRASIERPLEGTFRLVPGPSPQSFEVAAVAFEAPGGEYKISGSGVLHFGNALPTLSLVLDVEVNGTGGIRLISSPVVSGPPWPALDITVEDADPEKHPFSVYTIRINAAPRVAMVPYELLEGSTLIEDCSIPCGRPTILVPLRGTFLLGEIAGAPNPISTYRVDAIDFRNAAGARSWQVTGAGFYRRGGEVANLQSMDLEVQVNDTREVHLVSGNAAVGEPFPAIRIVLEHQNPASPLFVYTLEIVARPEEFPRPFFRRGDANADGEVDISDAVSVLVYLFAGGSPLPCSVAADSDFNDSLEITDAIVLLEYLFLGGPAPPQPGPRACGFAPRKTVLDCASYPSCN